jgi:hypothetical protein
VQKHQGIPAVGGACPPSAASPPGTPPPRVCRAGEAMCTVRNVGTSPNLIP